MALQGGDFAVDVTKTGRILDQIKSIQTKVDKMLIKKVTAATNIAYATASAKRPLISKQEMRASGRSHRVSDPNAEAGVPVDTGALRASITKKVEVKGKKVVGTVDAGRNIPYALAMEYGRPEVNIQARPYMRPALALNKEIIKKIFKEP